MKRKIIITTKGKLEEEVVKPFIWNDVFWNSDIVISNVSYSYPPDSSIIVEPFIDVVLETLIDVNVK